MSPATKAAPPAAKPRLWIAEGIFDGWRIDSTTLIAATPAEAKAAFRARYDSPRKVRGVTVRPAAKEGTA